MKILPSHWRGFLNENQDFRIGGRFVTARDIFTAACVHFLARHSGVNRGLSFRPPGSVCPKRRRLAVPDSAVAHLPHPRSRSETPDSVPDIGYASYYYESRLVHTLEHASVAFHCSFPSLKIGGIRDLYADADVIRVVLDNLNTYKAASLCKGLSAFNERQHFWPSFVRRVSSDPQHDGFRQTFCP